MDIISLKAQERSGTGKSFVRKARVRGWIPAVVYGHGRETRSIEVSGRDLLALIRSHKTNFLIRLEMNGSTGEDTAIIKEIQRNPVKDAVLYHVDFQVIKMDETVTVSCPVVIIGEPAGVKEGDGVLENPGKHLTVECLPMNIPEKIEIDVSALQVGDSIHVRDISVPDGEIKDSGDEVIAVVTHEKAPAAEEPEKPEEEAGGEEGAAGEETDEKGEETGEKPKEES